MRKLKKIFANLLALSMFITYPAIANTFDYSVLFMDPVESKAVLNGIKIRINLIVKHLKKRPDYFKIELLVEALINTFYNLETTNKDKYKFYILELNNLLNRIYSFLSQDYLCPDILIKFISIFLKLENDDMLTVMTSKLAFKVLCLSYKFPINKLKAIINHIEYQISYIREFFIYHRLIITDPIHYFSSYESVYSKEKNFTSVEKKFNYIKSKKFENYRSNIMEQELAFFKIYIQLNEICNDLLDIYFDN